VLAGLLVKGFEYGLFFLIVSFDDFFLLPDIFITLKGASDVLHEHAEQALHIHLELHRLARWQQDGVRAIDVFEIMNVTPIRRNRFCLG
jgi:hypothetical protein